MSPDDPRHGTNAGYIAGCRDHCCREAHAAYKRGLRRRRYQRRTDRLYVDATGTRRRIQALVALGWTYRDINRHAGWNADHPGGNAHNVLRQTAVHLDTHEKVCQVYDRLSMRVPAGPLVDRQRRIAQRKGWLPPLAWDDDRIDDPTYKPTIARTVHRPDDVDEAVVLRVLDGEWLPTTHAERLEIMRRWRDSGRSARSLTRRMGWHDGRYAQAANTERRAS